MKNAKSFKINKSDNKNTRILKKRTRKKLLRTDRNFVPKSTTDSEQIRKKQYYSSPIQFNNEIERFCELNKISSWKRKSTVFKLDETFDLFNFPDNVLRSLLEMLRHAKTINQNARVIYKNDVSFGAIYLVDNLCWEIGKKRNWILETKGLPSDEREMLANLKTSISHSSHDQNSDIINERVRVNRGHNLLINQAYRVTSKEISEMIQSAVREVNNNPDFDLDPEVLHAINSTITEHFDNIQQHTESEFGYICSFYDKRKKEIRILIYNFGQSIYDKITGSKFPENILAMINDVVLAHFPDGKDLQNLTIENAITLLALQEGVSSKLLEDITRGHGIIDYIENCFQVNENAKIVIISGKTAIKIDGKYKTKEMNFVGRKRRILALNKSNNVFEKPDSDYVLPLKYNFPGVIIETIIPLTI